MPLGPWPSVLLGIIVIDVRVRSRSYFHQRILYTLCGAPIAHTYRTKMDCSNEMDSSPKRLQSVNCEIDVWSWRTPTGQTHDSGRPSCRSSGCLFGRLYRTTQNPSNFFAGHADIVPPKSQLFSAMELGSREPLVSSS